MSSITNPQPLRIQPDYIEEVITLNFTNNEECDLWYTNVAAKHAVFRLHTTRKPKTSIPGRPITIDGMMQAASVDQFNETWTAFKDKYTFKDKYENDSSIFFKYFENLWYNRKELWSKAYRKDAPFYTNNLIESYHNLLKTLYLGRKRRNRMDRTIYTLSKFMIADYRFEAAQVFYKIRSFNLTRIEKAGKERADEIDEDRAYTMIIEINEEVIPYYINHSSSSPSVSLASSSPSPSIQTSAMASTSSAIESAPSASSTDTGNSLKIMEFNNKISVMGGGLMKSIIDAKNRVHGDEILMDELYTKIKVCKDLIDDIGNRTIYSSRQS